MPNGQFISFKLEEIGLNSAWDFIAKLLSVEIPDGKSIDDLATNIAKYFQTHAKKLKDDLNHNTVQIIPEPYNQNIDFAEDLYVSGYCGLLQKAKREGGSDSFHISLADEALKAFLKKSITEYTSVDKRLAFVCGEPGAGKSTLARKIAYDLTADYEENPIKNKLNDLTNDLIPSLWKSLKSGFNRLIDGNIYHAEADNVPALCHFIPLGRVFYDSSHREGDTVTFKIPPFTKYLYLDGLDEVAFQSDANYHTPHQEGNIPKRFLSSIKEFLDRHQDIKIIIGLRTALYTELKKDILVGENTHILMINAPCYYLLPLYNQEQEAKRYADNAYVKIKGTIKDLREDYIQKNLKILQKDSQFQDILNIVQDKKYHAVSSEPILFMFLLRAICCDANEWHNKDIYNIAQLYDAVFQDFYIREIEKGQEANRLVKDCGSYTEFNNVLEVIALCAYSEGGKIASREKVKENLKTTFPNKNYHKYFSADEANVKNYAGIAMFYFGIHQKGNIEFLHKTFYEYFVARGILSLFECASGGNTKAQQDIMKLFFNKVIDNIQDNKIIDFLYDIIMLERFQDLCNPSDNFDKSVNFVNKILKDEISFLKTFDNSSKKIMTIFNDIEKLSYMIMGLINLLGILSGYKINSQGLNKNPLHYKLHFYNTIFLQTILYFYRQTPLKSSFISMNYLNLEGENLVGIDLFQADLVKVNFKHAKLAGANLFGTNLGGADFESADLTGVLFYAKTDLGKRSAYIEEVNFKNANLTGAFFRHIIFKKTDMRKAIINGTIFSQCNFDEADIRETSFNTLSIHNTDFYNTKYNKNTIFLYIAEEEKQKFLKNATFVQNDEDT